MNKCEHLDKYTDVHQYHGQCKKCGLKWRLYLDSQYGTCLEYYEGEYRQ